MGSQLSINDGYDQDKLGDTDGSQLPDTPVSGESGVANMKCTIRNLATCSKCTPQLPDTPISEESTIFESFDSSTSSYWSRGPGSDRWDILLDEAERFRQQQSMKRAELDQAYGAFRDKEPCFPDDIRHLTIPKNISGIDRVVVTAQLKSMIKREQSVVLCKILS